MKPLSLADSSVLKGIAILMMLFHHAFFTPGNFDDVCIGGHYWVLNGIALQCKICVAIFVFISGYALTAKYGNERHLCLRKFYHNRFVKLLFNFWFIWLIFVPLSVFWLSDKPFGWWYNGTNVTIKGILDFGGVLQWFYPSSWPYNPHWWYYSCITGLYLIFPFLVRLLRKSECLTFVISIVVYFIIWNVPFISGIRGYMLEFAAGMLYAKYSSLSQCRYTPPPYG